MEATGEKTETALLAGLRRQVPGLPAELGPGEALAALRRGRCLAAGRRCCWSSTSSSNGCTPNEGRRAHGAGPGPAAVRREPGAVHRHGAGRFLAGGEPLHAGSGSSASSRAELCAWSIFSIRAMLARCWPRLDGPSALARTPSDSTKDQEGFLDQAVAGLAQDGKVISRAAGPVCRDGQGQALDARHAAEVGGTEGVGVTFLEETFAASTAPPQYRLHQKAAQAVLKALLPEAGTRHQGPHAFAAGAAGGVGLWQPPQGLRRTAPHSGRPKLRLITPTDREGDEVPKRSRRRPGDAERYATSSRTITSCRRCGTG